MGCAIDRVLIANRGEVAVRVIRACRELGIEAVAVHLPGEAGDLHVQLADAVREIPSFLDPDAILGAAEALAADAIHPGTAIWPRAQTSPSRYAARITWVGPPAAAMRACGDKLAARRLAEAAGVPVVPGYAGVDLTDATLTAEAERVGFPLLVKAAGGGGGRGIRRVAAAADLAAALEAARREAKAGFDDERVYLERELDAARHVEIQLLADRHGNVIHLGERDCSAQRRHQKIVEEAPSPAVDGELRASPRRRRRGDRPCGRLRERRHRRVPASAGRQLVLSGAERPAAGGASGVGTGDRHRPGASPARDRAR